MKKHEPLIVLVSGISLLIVAGKFENLLGVFVAGLGGWSLARAMVLARRQGIEIGRGER